MSFTMVCHLIYRIYHAFHAFLHTERHISVSVAALFYMSSVGRLAGHTPPNKFPILYTLKRSNSKSHLSAFEHRLLIHVIFFLKIPIFAIQKSKEILGLTSVIFLRLDPETRHLREPWSVRVAHH